MANADNGSPCVLFSSLIKILAKPSLKYAAYILSFKSTYVFHSSILDGLVFVRSGSFVNTSRVNYEFFHLWKTCSSTWFSAGLVIHLLFALRVRVTLYGNFSFSSEIKDSSTSHRAQNLTKIATGNDTNSTLTLKKYGGHL